MKYPNLNTKHRNEAMIEPKRWIEYMKELGSYPSFPSPEGVILCYQKSLMDFALKNHAVTGCDGFLGRMHFLNETDNRVAVMGNFGIGSPAAAIVMEELAAFGVKNFISMGTAGTLQKQIEIGELVVCEKAIRDEGTSHHYIPTEKYVEPDMELTMALEKALSEQGLKYHRGTSWTIDAPYRETYEEARTYQKEGVMTVEMEASALFAVAKYRGLKIASLFAVSDSLADIEWHPQFHSRKTKLALENILKASIAALTSSAIVSK